MNIPPAKSAGHEQDELRELALLADAFAGLTHALNNHLNGIVLQAAALQLRLPPEFRDALDRIRREGGQAANLFRPIQMLRQQARQNFQPLDIAEPIRAILSDHPGWTFQSESSVHIPATLNAFRRMFQYFLEGIEEYHRPGAPGVISLANDPSPTLLVEFQLTDADAKIYLERLAESQEHDLSLRFLAVRSLLRLLEGRIEAAFPDDQAAQIRFIW